MCASSFRWTVTEAVIAHLNKLFKPLSPMARICKLYHFFAEKDVLFTSSFGTSSALLLSMVSRARASQQIHFIDTTYHFSETLTYKRKLTQLLDLQVIDVFPEANNNFFTRTEKTWQHDPNLCCLINKVMPLEEIKAQHKVWISGLMAHQNNRRAQLPIFEQKGDIIKFYPVVDMPEIEFYKYLFQQELPLHPLQTKGYGSIGCEQCTTKGCGRVGRWTGQQKTECGLHFNKTRRAKIV